MNKTRNPHGTPLHYMFCGTPVEEHWTRFRFYHMNCFTSKGSRKFALQITDSIFRIEANNQWWDSTSLHRFATTCSCNFFREPVIGLSQGFSILPHEHLLLILCLSRNQDLLNYITVFGENSLKFFFSKDALWKMLWNLMALDVLFVACNLLHEILILTNNASVL